LGGIRRNLLLSSLVLASAALPWYGCSDSDPDSSASSPATGKAADPLADAPVDWLEFLTWAEKKLDSYPPSVPIPTPEMVTQPRLPTVRLAEPAALQSARIACDWIAPSRTARALATIGPFRSDQPGPTFAAQIVPKATADGRDSLALLIGGFKVQSEEVGSIELTLRVPYGKYVALVWSSIGRVIIPVETHDEPFSVRVLTDGFAEWTGPREMISVLTDGLGEGVIEVQTMRFLPRDLSYAEPVGLGRLRLGHEIRTALYGHCPAETTFENVALPEGARLQVGLGCVAEQAGADSADQTASTRFEIILTDGENQQTVLDQQLPPTDTWFDTAVSLANWAGKIVNLTLKSTSTSTHAVAFWGNPTVYQPLTDPSLLVIYLIDTVAAEHVGFQGYHRNTMPRLAAAAQRGVWFSRAFSNSSRTIESIPDLMLSMPTERHGVHHNSTPAPEGLVTIADALRAAGHATASFCTNVNAGPRQGMDQGFDTFVDKITSQVELVDRTIPLEEVMAWIDRHRDRPMFVYIHTCEPHSPYTPPEGYRDRFDPDYRGKFTGIGFYQARNPRDVAHIMALYDEELVYADARFGMFIDALGRVGLLDKAHLFVTSDHGEEFLEHNDWEHGRNLHNEQTRVPLVAFGPTFGNRGEVDVPTQIFDIMPTILDMYDLPIPYPLAGRSLLPLLRADGTAGDALGHRNIYASNHNYRIDYNLLEHSLIEDGRWKLVFGAAGIPLYDRGPESRFTLFDLQHDPRERKSYTYARQDLTRRLAEDLVRWRLSQHVYDAGKPAATIIDPAHMRELEALGYVGDSTAPDKPGTTDDKTTQRDRDD
jgi:arylsulfatase A-like enzyme